MELEKDRGNLDAAYMEDEVDQEATLCQDTLTKVPEVTAKEITICGKGNMRWNRDIKARSMIVRQETRWCAQHSEGGARAKAELQESIRESHSQMRSDYLETLRAAEVW
jgi:hypothetical protein